MEIELSRVWHAIRKYWQIGLGVMVAFALLGGLISVMLPKEYTATSSFVIVPEQISGSQLVDSGTYISLAKSGPVVDRVNLELGLGMEREELQAKIMVSAVPGTQIIEISTTDSDPEQAAEITNATGRAFVAQVDELTTGNLQTALDSLQFESDALANQIVTIDQQLTEFDGDRADLPTEERLRFDELTASRLELSQTKADVDTSIRDIRRQVAVAQPVVVVNESANPPINANNVSPVIATIVAAVVGAIIGGLIILLLEFGRKGVRDSAHLHTIAGEKSLVDFTLNLNRDSQLAILAAKIANRANRADRVAVAFVSTGFHPAEQELLSSLRVRPELQQMELVEVLNVFDSDTDVHRLIDGPAAVLLVGVGRTTMGEVENMLALLRDLNVPMLGTILNK